MPTPINDIIPLTTLPVGPVIVGPSPLVAGYSVALVTIDRTVAGGLNSLTSATTVKSEIQQSDDGGATWNTIGVSQTQGGISSNHNGQVNIYPIQVSLSGFACQMRALITVAGSSVAVSGSLKIT